MREGRKTDELSTPDYAKKSAEVHGVWGKGGVAGVTKGKPGGQATIGTPVFSRKDLVKSTDHRTIYAFQCDFHSSEKIILLSQGSHVCHRTRV